MTSRELLAQLKNNPPLDGYLSVEYGFLPPALPLNKLSGIYGIWDQYAAQIPELYFSNQTQEILSAMPMLSVESLPNSELPRAALVLSLLAHAYWRHGTDRAFSVRMSEIDGELPDAIKLPWAAVNERLGRGSQPFQSFYDLFLNNFTLRSAPGAQGAYTQDDVTIENLDVLVPAFGNEAERVFFMAFVEMHAHAQPLVGCIVEIEAAIEQNDASSPARIIKALDKIEEILKKCLRTLRKISPMASSKTYSNPVLWAKTIAIFGVPAPNYVQGGTSGTFAPLVLALDALLNRKKYDSEYGRYAKKGIDQLLPAHIVKFVQETSKIDLVGYITSHTDAPQTYDALAEAYNRVMAVYAGPEGFLGKHMSKAFNYLGIATMVGRNQSTSGDERYVHQQTWVKVSQSLNVSRLERLDTAVTHPQSAPEQPTAKIPADLPIYGRLDLARHHKPDDYWVVIDGYIYDLTDYLKIHPGGIEIMLAYAGQDASAYFESIPEHTKPRIKKMMNRYLVGIFQEENQDDPAFTAWQQFLDKLIFIRAILVIQYQKLADEKLNTLSAGHAHTHFIQEHLKSIIEALPADPASQNEITQQHPWNCLQNMEFITRQDLRGEINSEVQAHFDSLSQFYQEEDLQLVDTLIEFVLNLLLQKRTTDPTTVQKSQELISQWMTQHLQNIKSQSEPQNSQSLDKITGKLTHFQLLEPAPSVPCMAS